MPPPGAYGVFGGVRCRSNLAGCQPHASSPGTMRQVLQSYRSGELWLADVPTPACQPGGVLVRTSWSLLSAGTERMITDLAKKSLIAKAIKGDTRATNLINTMITRFLEIESVDTSEASLTDDEYAVLESLEEQFLRRARNKAKSASSLETSSKAKGEDHG